MRRIAALAVCAAALAPVAAAAAPSRLDLMPLPRSALGPGAGKLALDKDSGVATNADAARNAGHGVTAGDLARAGRVTGYTLDWVLPGATVPQPVHKLLGVQTIAELYRDTSTATRGLAFWRGVTKKLGATEVNGITVSLVPFPARVADGTFAFELTYHDLGQPIYYVGDVVFRSGDLLGAVFVTASDRQGLRARVLHLANGLAKRIRRVQSGRRP